MTRVAVLLRGVNLGARNKVSMPVLRGELARSGFTGVQTYVASGNVVVDLDGSPPDDVAGRVRSLVAQRFGVDVPCLARTVEELDATVAADPLGLTGPAGTHLDDPRLYTVVFLDRAPDKERLATVEPAAFAPERFGVVGRDLHTWLPAGTRQARLVHSFWERRLGVVGTARNWRTVLALQRLLRG